MVDHVGVESAKGRTTVRIPDGFAGQIVLHCSGGMVLKYTVNEVRRPTSPNGGHDLTEARRSRRASEDP
jgi:hypothetical protein